MEQEMKVLILEDADYDAEIILYELSKLNVPLHVRRVVTRGEFLEALNAFRPALILADYRLPAFDGLTALALAQEKCPEVPFIFVSGAMTPELVQKGVQRGATECISKDRLSQLSQAVARSLESPAPPPPPVREPGSPEGNLWLDLFQDNTSSMMVVLAVDGTVLEFNLGAERLTGWQRQEVLGRDLVALLVAEDRRAWVQAKLARGAAGEVSRDFELPVISRSGAIFHLLCHLNRLDDGQDRPGVLLLVAQDQGAGWGLARPAARAARTFTVTSRLNLIC